MTATDHTGAPEGVAQDIEAPVAGQAAVGPLTGDPAIVGVPTFVVGSVMLGLALINYAHRRTALPAGPSAHDLIRGQPVCI